MIKKMNDVYQDLCDKEGYDYKFIKSVGDSVFDHLKDKMLRLDDTNLWVSYLGYFVIKSRKIENQCKRYLSMRAYKEKKYPGYIDKPIGSFAKKLFSVYLNKIVKFKKYKADFSLKQVEFCKNLVKTYKNDNNDNTPN